MSDDLLLGVVSPDQEGRIERLGYTGLIGGLEHLKIETRLIDERISNVMCECMTLRNLHVSHVLGCTRTWNTLKIQTRLISVKLVECR
jgi:hypothetical protein